MEDEKWDYKIIIPEAPNSANHPNDDIEKNTKDRHMTWQRLWLYKKRWEIKARLYKANLPNLNGKKLHIKFRFYFKRSKKRDNDNFFIVMKGMIDGFFEEDDEQNLKCDFPDLLIDRENPRTEIFIKII